MMKIEDLITKPYKFIQRKEPIPCSMRSIWRIAFIILSIQNGSKNNNISLEKLVILNWVSKSEEHYERLMNLLDNTMNPYGINISIEPSLDRALALAIGEEFIFKKNDSYFSLTDKGLAFASELNGDDSVMEREKYIFSKLKQKLTINVVKNIMNWERIL